MCIFNMIFLYMCISAICFLYSIIPLDLSIYIHTYISVYIDIASLLVHPSDLFLSALTLKTAARMSLLEHGSDQVTPLVYILQCCCKR